MPSMNGNSATRGSNGGAAVGVGAGDGAASSFGEADSELLLVVLDTNRLAWCKQATRFRFE